MDAGLSIADSALNAALTEIDVTSENIANAQTPGYIEETAQLAPQPGGDAEGVGDGVAVSSVSQAASSMLLNNNWQAQGALSGLTSLQQVLTGVEDVFPIGESASATAATNSSTTSTNSNSSLAGQLANFWSAWDAIATDPSGSAAQQNVVDLAQGLVTTLGESSQQLGQLAANGATQLGDAVTELNSLLGQASSLNGSIVAISGSGGSPNQLEDQLNDVIGQISQLANVSVSPQQNGGVNVSLGGVTLVQGTSNASLSLEDVGGTYSLTSSSGGFAVPVSGGSIGGLLAGLNQYIPSYGESLDDIADSLATTVNNQLAQGYTIGGVSGSTYPMFSGTTASTISVNSALANNPSLLAVSGSNGAAGANDASNAQQMAELATSTTGPDSLYQDLVQSLGAATESVNTQVSAQTSVANQAQSTLNSSTGVDLDNELTSLMNFQESYQASAKLLSTLDAATQALLNVT